MGSTGKAAFVAIIVLGAITGIVMYSLFDLYTIPKPGIINSVDRTNLTATPSEEAGSTLEGGTTEKTPTTPTTQGGGGSTTTNAPVVAGVTITIQKGASIQGSPDYNPDTAKVPMNDNVVWVNEDTAAHTATSATTAAATLTIPVGAATPGNPSYDPLSLTVKKGDEIDVVNKDSPPHTVTSGKAPDAPDAGKQFDTSIVNVGASAKVATANLEPGEYDFHCAVHPFMLGKLKVE